MKEKDFKLHQFLRKHGAVRKFQKAAKEDGCNTYQEHLEYGETDPTTISGAFIWSETPEGGAYWANLDDLYRKLLNEG